MIRSTILVSAILALGAAAAPASAHPACVEDQACWTWSTMGNERRGVYVKNVRAIRTVSTCTFRKMERAARIDWTRTERLRGDHLARRWGCNVNYPA